MKQTTEPFEELIIPRRDMSLSSIVVYRIYSDSKNYELVEASSAIDALSNSKVKNIFKVMRHDPLGENVIQWNQVLNAINTDNVSVPIDEFESTPLQETEDSSEVVAADATESVENSESMVADSQSVEVEEVQATEAVEEEKLAAEEPALSNDDVDKLLNG